MRMPNAVAACLAIGLSALVSIAAAAQEAPRRITANVFRSGAVWPLWVGIENGFFREKGIDLALTYTQNSRSQMTGLIGGEFEIALTALDNVIAYMEGQGGVTFDTPPMLVAVAGAGDGFLSLITAADVKTFADIRGRKLAVDALSTGFSFVLQDMLAHSGLGAGTYALDSVGGTEQRWQALEAGTEAGALLTPPVSLVAGKKGFNILAHASETLGGYQGLVVTLRRAWARDNDALVVRFIAAYRQSLDWLFDPRNRERAIEILRAQMPGTSAEMGQLTYDFFLHPGRGFNRDGGIDMKGARNVMEMRSRYMHIAPPLAEVGKYVDMGYFDRSR